MSRNCVGLEAAAASRSLDPGPMSLLPPIPDARCRSLSSARAWSVSSRPRATITGSVDGSRASASRRTGANAVAAARRARTSGNSSRASERRIHSRLARGRRVGAAVDRRGATARFAHGSARRRSRPRCAATSCRRRDRPAGVASSRSVADAGSQQVRSPVSSSTLDPECAAYRGRTRGEAASWVASRRRRGGSRLRSAPARSPGASSNRASLRAASRRMRRRPPRSARRRGPAPRRAVAVRLGDDVQTVVHPVDKVHVGDAGWPEHGRVALAVRPKRACDATVVLADVRLHLHDPADPALRPERRRGQPERPAGRRAASCVLRRRGVARRRSRDRRSPTGRSPLARGQLDPGPGRERRHEVQKAGIERLLEHATDLRAARWPVPEAAQERQLVRRSGMPVSTEVRAQDDHEEQQESEAWTTPSSAAEELVDEAGAPRRSRSVCRSPGSRSRTATAAATKTIRNPIMYAVLQCGNCVQFVGQEVAQGAVGAVGGRKNENRMDAIPSSRRMVPWTEPRTKTRRSRPATSEQVHGWILRRELADVHRSASGRSCDPGAGDPARPRVAAPASGSQGPGPLGPSGRPGPQVRMRPPTLRREPAANGGHGRHRPPPRSGSGRGAEASR